MTPDLIETMARAHEGVHELTAHDPAKCDFCGSHLQFMTGKMRAAIKAAEEAGYVLTLAVPTEHMIVAGDERIIEALNDHTGVLRDPTPAHAAYISMLSARPKG